jgi:MOSC domain-containing protein YiiM
MASDTKLISVNIGLPRVIMNNGEPITTGIFKEPVAGRVMLRTLNLDGDRQADLSVHGGASKAAYAYPSEHYEYWKQELLSASTRQSGWPYIGLTTNCGDAHENARNTSYSSEWPG